MVMRKNLCKYVCASLYDQHVEAVYRLYTRKKCNTNCCNSQSFKYASLHSRGSIASSTHEPGNEARESTVRLDQNEPGTNGRRRKKKVDVTI